MLPMLLDHLKVVKGEAKTHRKIYIINMILSVSVSPIAKQGIEHVYQDKEVQLSASSLVHFCDCSLQSGSHWRADSHHCTTAPSADRFICTILRPLTVQYTK